MADTLFVNMLGLSKSVIFVIDNKQDYRYDKITSKKATKQSTKKQIVERIAYPHPSCRKCFKICTISAPASGIFFCAR